MNKTLIFLCISCTLIVFSIITICTGPILTGSLSASNWRNQNCQHYADHRKYIDDERIIPDKIVRDEYKKYLKYMLENHQNQGYYLSYIFHNQNHHLQIHNLYDNYIASFLNHYI